MKRLLTLIALFPLLAFGQGAVPSGTSLARIGYNGQLIGSVIGATGLSTPVSYLIKQGFEGTGYDNSETWSETGAGTIDEDYTSVALDGSQSLRMAASAQTAYADSPLFADTTNCWWYFLFRPVSLPASTQAIGQISTDTTQIVRLRMTATGALEVRPTGGTAVTTTGTLSAGTTYHVWVHFITGTGADAYAGVAFSTDGVKPTSGDNFRGSNNGTVTTSANKIMFGVNASGTYEWIFDKVRVDDATIGDSPE